MSTGPRTIVVVGALLASFAVLPPANAVHNSGFFELDGNATAGASAGDDWSTLFPTNTSSTVFNYSSIHEPEDTDTTYFSVSSKDINDINTWSVTGNSAPPKDEIVNAFAAAYNDSTKGMLLYFGADRWANNGDAAVGFWFLQGPFTIVNGSVVGNHVNNDTLVVSHFTNGGAVATIYVYKWLTAADPHLTLIATGADCATVSANDMACAKVNGALTPSVLPYQGSGSKDPVNQYPANSFFEGGINLTALYGGSPPCFSNFVAETRSSQETTAVLKDIAFQSFNNCPVVPPLAVITVEKVALPPVVDIGTNVTFGITVTNSGPDPAANTILWDDLPALSGAWSVSGPDAGACTITGLNLTCLFGTVAVFDTRSIILSAATGVAPGDCGLKPNTVRITANDGLANDQSFAEVYVTCADVSVLKTADASPINAGDTASYTLTVTSLGPDAAVNVNLTDTLPSIVGTWSAVPSAGSCGIAAGVLSCAFGTLAMGETRTIGLSAPTAFADCGVLPNTATVSASVDTDHSNNVSSASITVLCPDLSILKTADAQSVSAGSSIGFTITVSNAGPGDAYGVTLTDALPGGSGVDWSISPANADCGVTGTAPTQTLGCAFGTIASGGSESVHVTSATQFASCGAYPNTASANATNHGVVQSSASTTVLCPDLQVLKTADAASVSAGAPIGFTITLGNGGPGTATSVTLNDPLPTGPGISWTIDPANADCSIVANTLTCSFGDLAAGASESVHVTSATSFASCAAYENTATAGAANHANVTASASTTVLCPQLNVLKTADAASVSAGSPIGFTINVSNSGAGTATGVTLNDALPTGAGIAWSIDPANAACSIVADTLVCGFGDLASGASVTVHVTSPTTFASCAEYPNTATATAANHASVQSSASTTVLCPDLSATKTADAASVSAGSPIGFNITVSNAGPGVATGVTLNDPLPTGAGIAWTIDPANADCSIVANTLTCSFGDLAAGASKSVHVTSPTTFASCADYPNTASANATNHPSVSAGASTTVLCPDLSIEKNEDAVSVSAGSPIGFTITVSNAGPGVATGVTLNDPLPTGAGIAWSIDPANADCSITAGTLACSFGDLAAGASKSVHVTSPTTFASCAEYPNTASASATNHPSVNANASTTVLCPSLEILKTADAASVSAGDPIGFTITVSNGGPGTATGVTLNDPLPSGPGIAWSISPANADCSITTGTLTCSFGDLASGATVGVHVVSNTSYASCAEYPNTASANATNHPTVSASASTTVLCPSLDIQKTADAASVSAGSSIGFTITVSNAGPGVAADVTLNDPLPGGAGVDWSISPANADCSITGSAPAQTLTCDFGDLASGASVSVHIVSSTAYASCGVYPNTATAASTNHPTLTASASTTVLCPDLDVLKTADAASVSAGTSIGFTITVSNAGPGTATSVTLNDPLPTGAGIAWSIDPANADCSITTGTLACSFGDLAAGASETVHVTSPTEYASCGAYPNTATASATNHPSVESTDDVDVLCPDVSLLKLAIDATVSAGATIGFTITVENTGLGTATGVTLSDPLPGGLGLNWSISPANADCSITGSPPAQTLTCDFGDMPQGATASVGVTSATEYASCGEYPNTATLSSTNHPTLTANATTAVLCPNLEILKTADAASVSAGEDIGFTVTLTNAGTGTATGVTLSDALPAGSGIDWSISPASADCSILGSPPTETLSCTFGDLSPAETVGVHVVSATSFASCAEYPNTASASATNHPTVSASASTTVLCPSIDVLKTAHDASVSAGSPIGFAITLSNAGPGTAFDVMLNDPLPGGSGVDWSISPPNAACSITGLAPAQTLTCDFGDLASGASDTVHIVSATAYASCAEYVNTASLSATNHATVSSTASTRVLCPDLDVLKTADAASVSAGSPIGFAITVSNAGPGVATGVTLNDPLPTGAGIAWSIDPANADCSVVANTLTCSFGDLAPSDSRSVHVTSPTSYASCAEYTNTASANATNHPTVTATASTTVLCPDLDALKTADNASVSAGDPIGFTITVSNAGPGTATGVALNDPLPTGAGISWSIDPANADCGIVANTLTCSFGDLASGATETVHVTSPTAFASCAEYVNTASAGAQNHADVQATASTIVLCPDLRLVKTGDAANVTAGSPIGFTLTVSNVGSGEAKDVTLTDALPGGPGIDWSIDPANAACSITGALPNETLTCAFGDLAPGATVTVHVTSPTTPASCAEYPNSATAGATNHGNVSSSSTTRVDCPAIATRTQGFWATHTAYTQRIFDNAVGGTMTVGGGSHTRIIDDHGKLFGSWYSSISSKTTGQKRSQVDAARMVLLQQLVTAKLNCAAFGCTGNTTALILAADAAYAGNSKALMANYTWQLDAYNNGGDDVPLPTIWGSWNPATPDLSRAIANKLFWDTP